MSFGQLAIGCRPLPADGPRMGWTLHSHRPHERSARLRAEVHAEPGPTVAGVESSLRRMMSALVERYRAQPAGRPNLG